MAEERSHKLTKREKEKGIRYNEKAPVVPLEQRMPYDPENIGLSKKEFVEKQNRLKEKAARMKEAEQKIEEEMAKETFGRPDPEPKTLEGQGAPAPAEEEVETKVKPKKTGKRGRKKK